ncbi:MAG: DUF975 family protein, partial [Lachnospiraceae bacterium]|nr:DUF975 family protein [Lachnospiraceae bacterium]
EDSKCGILESLKRSCQLMKGHKRRLFALYLSFFLYALLTLGTFGLGSFWLQPYMEMIRVQFYLDITGREVPEDEPDKESGEAAEENEIP